MVGAYPIFKNAPKNHIVGDLSHQIPSLQCEAPKIAKLVYKLQQLWFMVLTTIVTGAYKPTNMTGGPLIVVHSTKSSGIP